MHLKDSILNEVKQTQKGKHYMIILIDYTHIIETESWAKATREMKLVFKKYRAFVWDGKKF